MNKIPSREFLLGWLTGYFYAHKFKNMGKYLKDAPREDLYTRYLTAIGKS